MALMPIIFINIKFQNYSSNKPAEKNYIISQNDKHISKFCGMNQHILLLTHSFHSTYQSQF
jgi:hypothetical protein